MGCQNLYSLGSRWESHSLCWPGIRLNDSEIWKCGIADENSMLDRLRVNLKLYRARTPLGGNAVLLSTGLPLQFFAMG